MTLASIVHLLQPSRPTCTHEKKPAQCKQHSQGGIEQAHPNCNGSCSIASKKATIRNPIGPTHQDIRRSSVGSERNWFITVTTCKLQNPNMRRFGRVLAGHGGAAGQGRVGKGRTPTYPSAGDRRPFDPLEKQGQFLEVVFSEARRWYFLFKLIEKQSEGLTCISSAG